MVRSIDELRGTPEGHTVASQNTPKNLKAATVALSAALAVAPMQAEAQTVEKSQHEDDKHKVEHAKYTHAHKNTETTYDASVHFGVMPFSGAEVLNQDVLKTEVEKSRDGDVKSEYNDVTKNTTILNGNLKNEAKQTIQENTYYANGNLKSEDRVTTEHITSGPSATSVAQGHTDAWEQTKTDETSVKLKRDGNLKEEHMHSTYSSNNGTEIRVDLYTKGGAENPKQVAEVRARDSQFTQKTANIYHQRNNTEYTAKVTETNESYTFSKNNKEYDVTVGENGDIDATKYVTKKDGNVTEKEMGDVLSKMWLDAMHRKADRAVKKATEKEHNSAQQYFDSVAAEKKNTPILSDPFEKMPANFAKIKAEVEASAENKMNEAVQLSAEELLQQKMQQDGRLLAEKTGRKLPSSTTQKQTAGTSKENATANTQNNVVTNVAMQKYADNGR